MSVEKNEHGAEVRKFELLHLQSIGVDSINKFIRLLQEKQLLDSAQFTEFWASEDYNELKYKVAGDFADLPRIGEKIAKRIVDFRKKHGKFKRIEDLMKVKGVGEKTFNRFKKRLRL